MVSTFKNPKPFLEFAHFILELIDPTRMPLGPIRTLPWHRRDPTWTLSGPGRDPSKPKQDTTGPYQDITLKFKKH
jgi:hypothetical protein